jgi:hypothetical protein
MSRQPAASPVHDQYLRFKGIGRDGEARSGTLRYALGSAQGCLVLNESGVF